MKFSVVLYALGCVMLCIACGDKKSDEVREQARESLNVEDQSTQAPQTNFDAVQTEPPVATGSVHHYICPNNCEGSGGATQVNCPVCGTQYVHNQAYHTQAPSQGTTDPGATTVTPGATTTPSNPPPAQNAAGVYHYTCPNGCEGGAATAGTCASCGAALAHNSAYHQ